MKIMMQISILAVVDIKELPGISAKIQMLTPKLSISPVLIPSDGEETPDLDTSKDFILMAGAHVLKFCSDGAQERLQELGEMSMTQVGGQA